LPMTAGGCGLAAMVLVAVCEKGRLYRNTAD
jgi:hypothetical protein